MALVNIRSNYNIGRVLPVVEIGFFGGKTLPGCSADQELSSQLPMIISMKPERKILFTKASVSPPITSSFHMPIK